MNKMLTKIFSALVLSVISVSLVAQAGTPDPLFNMKQGDVELLSARNITQGQTATSDPISAASTDVVEGVVYYHNGVQDSMAKNVVIKVGVDTTSASQKHYLTASISADNAPTVTDTVVGGVIVGKTGLTINLDSASQISIIPGSVRWFSEGGQTPTTLINGQNGSELFSATGLKLGDIQGCWAHAGYIMFQMKFVKSNIVLSKSAFNNTQNVDATKVTAKAGDSITYSLTTKNIGTADKTNYIVKDGIKDVLDYATVTSVSDNGVIKDQSAEIDRNNQTIVEYPTVNIAAGQTIVRTFTVSVKNPLPTNPAVGYAYDNVMFNHYGNDVVIVVGQPVLNMSITKGVRNIAKNESSFTPLNAATPGDGLEYLITVKNTGNTPTASVLKDVLPNGVDFVAGSVVVMTNNAVITPTGDLLGSGLNLPALKPNQELTVTFRVVTSANLADATNLHNVATVIFNNSQLQAHADTVIVRIPVVPTTPATTLPTTGAGVVLPIATFVGMIGLIARFKIRI